MVYRKEFDGLRAIAVIAVILYHLNNNYLPNGFLGVDIFLVISGFLITSIIQGGLKENRFDIFIFLKKRFFRIYPAYFTVTCLTLIAASMLLPKASFEIIKSSAIYSLLGIPNLYFYRDLSESYFKIQATYPLLHLWSIGLELQFYCVWPAILLIANKFKINTGHLIIFLCLLSFSFAAYFNSNPTTFMILGHEFSLGKKFIFYLLPARIWEFGIGALASIYIRISNNALINLILSTIGMTMVFGVLCYFNGTGEYSPYLALFPCVGIFLFMTCYSEDTLLYKIISYKFLVTIGIISYSLYLWHYPLIEFFKHFYEPYDLLLQIITTLIFVFLAVLSYKFVESYYRNTKNIISFTKYCTFFLFLVIFSYVYNKNELNSDFYKFTSDFPGSCLYRPGDNRINNFDIKKCTVGSDLYTPNILVVGSSHSNNFVPFLSVFAKHYGFSFVNITANSTEYTKEYLLTENFKNDQERIKLHDRFYKLINGIASDFDILITCPSWADTNKEIFAKTLEGWSRKFKMVILINHIPNPSNINHISSPGKFKLRRALFQKGVIFSFYNYSTFVEAETKKYDNVFDISLNDLIVDSKGQDDEQHSLYFDADHLSIGGGMYLARRIIQDSNPNFLKSSKFLDLAKSKK